MDERSSAPAPPPPSGTRRAPSAIPLGANIPLAFRDDARLREHAYLLGLSRLQADFARCLALSSWLGLRPLRQLWFRPQPRAERDDHLLALLRNAGWALRGLDDDLLNGCWESRWEFVPALPGAPARFRNGPSYHDRLRLDLLLASWERMAANTRCDGVTLALMTRRLAEASAAFRPGFGLPLDLLERAVEEHRDAAAGPHPRPDMPAVAPATRELAPLLARLAQHLWMSPG